MLQSSSTTRRRLDYAIVRLELGDVLLAEREVAEVLDEEPDDVSARALFAKIKHIKGELSQAIALWARIHTQAPSSHSALLQLRSMLHLAMDPERGAGDYLALGALHMVRKPRAQLELEEAFGLYLARRPDEARRRCEALAARNEDNDRDVYKLAVLANAWIAELTGETEEAVAILEALGEQRGFATDTDRVHALVPLYQRVGTREKLEAAVHICNYLHRNEHEGIGVLATLGSLHQRLGELDRAARYREEYLAAFRRSMNRPTRSEVVRVAAERYVPLHRLVALPLARGSTARRVTRRERAITHVLDGDLARAGEELGEGTALLDRVYEADCEVIAGDEAAATERYLAAIEADPGDVDLSAWLLDQQAESRHPRVVEVLTREDVAEVQAAALRQAAEREPTNPERWHRLAVFWRMQANGRAQAEAFRERAFAQAQAAERSRHPVGRVLAAAVYYFVGKQKGLIHEVWAEREPSARRGGGTLPTDRILGSLSGELSRAVQNVFLSVREYARSKFPHLTEDILDHEYSYKVTKEDEPSHGASAHLPSAVAFLSVFLRRPVPQDLALSGALVTDAHDVMTVRAVGDTEHKVKAAVNRNLRRIILPRENQAELVANPMIPNAILDQYVWFVSDLDEVTRIVFGEDVFATLPYEATASARV